MATTTCVYNVFRKKISMVRQMGTLIHGGVLSPPAPLYDIQQYVLVRKSYKNSRLSV